MQSDQKYINLKASGKIATDDTFIYLLLGFFLLLSLKEREAPWSSG